MNGTLLFFLIVIGLFVGGSLVLALIEAVSVLTALRALFRWLKEPTEDRP